MGRIFEVRKSAMFARWDKMAKNFTRIGKEIAIAVKAAGPNPDDNAALRRCYQNAKSCNMPKDRVDAAVKRAMGKDITSYEEVLYEGYAPHGVAIIVESATDNNTRTVANLRVHFNKTGGAMGGNGSVSFQFTKMGIFKLKPDGLNHDDLELELIDFGLEELGDSKTESGDDILVIRCAYTEFGNMQKALEEKKLAVLSAELEWIPNTTIELNEEQSNEVLKCVDRLEQDEDVQRVFHNLA
jgi:YebC/PmpR family DNA-binding regulatory protein